MMNFRSDQGRIPGVMPTTLVVPPALESDARSLLNTEIAPGGAASNVWKNTADLIVTAFAAQAEKPAVALTPDRNTAERAGTQRADLVAASTHIFAGSLWMRNAAGCVTRGAAATGSFGIGRAETPAGNSAGANRAIGAVWTGDVFRFTNSAAADLIPFADAGKVCFIVDDQTVAKTDRTGTRSRAGIVDGVESGGVRVRFDEAVTKAAHDDRPCAWHLRPCAFILRLDTMTIKQIALDVAATFPPERRMSLSSIHRFRTGSRAERLRANRKTSVVTS